MILDKTLEFADGLDVSASTGTALIGDQVDLGAAVKNVGRGSTLYLVLQVETAFTSGGSATVDFQLVTDAQAAIAVDGTATVHWQTGDIAVADLVQGYRRIFMLPEGIDYERYLGVLVSTGTAATTAGAISAFLTDQPQNWAPYPEAVS